MKELSSELQEAKNKLAQLEPWVTMLDIECQDGTVIRLTDNGEDLIFKGYTYQSFPFKADVIKSSDDGKIPTVNLLVSNVDKILMPYVEAFSGMVSSKVVLYTVNSYNLGDNYSDLTMTFSILSSSISNEWITFSLGAPSPLRKKFPPDRYLATSCSWEFKSIECAYAGVDTTCTRRYSDCVNKGNDSRFGGFYGLSPDGFKVVY